MLMAVLVWQSVSMLGAWSVSQQVEDLEHLIVHCQDANHHHHADNALHMDDDGGPVQHLHADSGTGTAALLNSLNPTLAEVRSVSPPESKPDSWLSATLEGPLRPPMQRV